MAEPKSARKCWWCVHFEYGNSEADWSDVTPGSDFTIGCYKSHWTFNASSDPQETFGRVLSTAETCEDYKKEDK